MNPLKVAFHTLGCKLNFSESSTLARQLRQSGYEITGFDEVADIYVIHSCTVTAVAEKKSRAAISQAHRRNPEAKVAVIGCYSELSAEKLRHLDGVDWVLGNEEKFNLTDFLTAVTPGSKFISGTTAAVHPQPSEMTFHAAFSSGDRTRSFLKIQDGCDHFCTYCTIPYARGRSRSATASATLEVFRQAAATGIREVVLTGVNIGDFGRKNGESLYDLLQLLDKEAPVGRIRISSIEPELLTDDIINLMASSKVLMPHFHLPLQSGSDAILQAMKRRYNAALFAGRVSEIHAKMPHACIVADVIVGFPGEDDERFAETLQFLESLPLSGLHVFSFSSRPGTPAARYAGQVDAAIKKERSRLLQNLTTRKQNQFYNQCKGMAVNVLFESDNNNGFMSGFSENYIRVKTAYNPTLINRVVPIELQTRLRNGVYLYEPVITQQTYK
jgi:threonylcarbamoyladenosine tRNA methylthiotransferase MtaB